MGPSLVPSSEMEMYWLLMALYNRFYQGEEKASNGLDDGWKFCNFF